MAETREDEPRDARHGVRVDEPAASTTAAAPSRLGWLTGTVSARILHGLVAAMALTGVCMELSIALTSGGGVATVAARVAAVFCYFTILSNLLVGITSLMLLVDPRRDGAVFRVARLDAVLCMTVTGIVYNTVLSGLRELSQAGAVSNFLLHQGGPVLVVLAWLIVGPRPRTDARTIWWSMAAPLAWIVYTFIAGAITGFYPYPFMNVVDIGYGAALLNTGIVVVIFLAFATLLGWIDRKLKPVPTA